MKRIIQEKEQSDLQRNEGNEKTNQLPSYIVDPGFKKNPGNIWS